VSGYDGVVVFMCCVVVMQGVLDVSMMQGCWMLVDRDRSLFLNDETYLDIFD
jgi:hypothetical protein